MSEGEMALLIDLKYEGTVQKIAVDPGDVIVVRLTDELVTNDVAERVKEKVQGYFPNNKVMVYGRGVEIGVLKEVK